MRIRFVIGGLAVAMLLTLLAVPPLEAGGRHHRSHIGVHFSPLWWGWGSVWGAYYGPYYPRRYYPVAESLVRRDVGAVDLNVRPKKADVYVNGELAGRAGRFDGFPGYLWLDDGEHQLVFVHEDYATVAKTIEVRGGALVDLRLRLQPGVSRPASEFFVERPARRRATPERIEPYSDRERDRVPPADRSRERSRPTARGQSQIDARSESARLKVEITPQDASVYLDGRFLGSVADLERLHSGILVDAGDHTLSVVRPGYVGSELDFEAVSSEEVVLKIELEPEAVE